MTDDQTIADATQLRGAYRQPHQGALDKVIGHVDEGVAAFIAASPLFVLSTSNGRRTDASPRGGPAGFVRRLDRHRLAWGDLVGNNRLDSFGNMLDGPRIGMLFFIPGVLETLRVNGTARLVRVPEVLEACSIDGRTPNTAVVVAVEECFVHCGAALRRSNLWDTTTWPARERVPSPAAMLKAHVGLAESAAEVEAGLEDYYANHIWMAGGEPE